MKILAYESIWKKCYLEKRLQQRFENKFQYLLRKKHKT